LAAIGWIVFRALETILVFFASDSIPVLTLVAGVLVPGVPLSELCAVSLGELLFLPGTMTSILAAARRLVILGVIELIGSSLSVFLVLWWVRGLVCSDPPDCRDDRRRGEKPLNDVSLNGASSSESGMILAWDRLLILQSG
jgi:hypothetical protein